MHATLAIQGALLPSNFPTAQTQALETFFAQHKANGLKKALQRAKPQHLHIHQNNNDNHSTPFENWCWQAFHPSTTPSWANIIAYQAAQAQTPAQKFPLTPAQTLQQTYWCLSPIHLQLNRADLIVNTLEANQISDAASQSLFQKIEYLFVEQGMKLYYIASNLWLLAADLQLQTNSLAFVDQQLALEWHPQGTDAQKWRKIVNEIEMSWYEHPVNIEREQTRQPAINSVWLWGGNAQKTPNKLNLGISPFSRVESTPTLPWQLDLLIKTHEQAKHHSNEENTHQENTNNHANNATEHLLYLDQQLLICQQNNDWQAWQDQLKNIIQEKLHHLLELLRRGVLKELNIVLFGTNEYRQITLHKTDLWHFWRNTETLAWLIESHDE